MERIISIYKANSYLGRISKIIRLQDHFFRHSITKFQSCTLGGCEKTSATGCGGWETPVSDRVRGRVSECQGMLTPFNSVVEVRMLRQQPVPRPNVIAKGGKCCEGLTWKFFSLLFDAKTRYDWLNQWGPWELS